MITPGSGPETPRLTIVVPCYNEVGAIRATIDQLRVLQLDRGTIEIVVVDDGSDDGSGPLLDEVASGLPGLVVIHHERNRGYGAALKTGIDHANAPFIAITDADGTYPNDCLPRLLAVAEGCDMAVGARTGDVRRYPLLRRIPKWFLTRWASWMTRRTIPDINSGLRVMKKSALVRYLGILPDGFSFTTTITLALVINRFEVRFVPIDYAPRIGRSKIRPIRDTIGFFILILRTGTYFAPLRVFLPVALFLFGAALTSFAYDVFVLVNLTDKTTLLFLFALNAGMFALLADMIDKRSAR